MENVLYQKTIVPAGEAADGETPTILYATEERNGYAILLCSVDLDSMLAWYPRYIQPSTVIDDAVDRSRKLLDARRTEKIVAAGGL
jgi:hypothetical protein